MNTLDSTFIRALIYQLISGNAFYLSLVTLTLLAAFRIHWKPPQQIWVRVVDRMISVTALIFLILTLGSLTLYWIVFLTLLLLSSIVAQRFRKPIFRVAVVWLALCILLAALYETRGDSRADPGMPIVVLGDSLCVAYNVEEEQTWPRLIEQRSGRKVVNLARAGAHLADILKLLDEQMPANCLVILEGGGNDVLTGTPPAEYASQLNAIFQRLKGHHNHVIVLEVPAPPSAPWYAWVQKHTASRHGVTLLPKRVMADVIFGKPGMTVDDLHLSVEGHQRMAEAVLARTRF